MRRLLLVLLMALPAILQSFAAVTVTAADTAVRFVGRVQRLDGGGVRFDWVGTYAETVFQGTGVSVRMSDDGESWYNVFIDGRLHKVIDVKGSAPHDILLASRLADGTHRLTLQKRTEGEYGCSTIFSFTSDGNAAFKSAGARRKMIEFIGDSYTCGYGAEGQSAKEHFKLSTENCDKAYACVLAHQLDADYCLIAHSGMGVTRNYRGKPMRNMSQRYPLLFDDHDSIPYDFLGYVPDMVIINLGTNDFSVGGAPDDFVEKYLTLINTVRSHYPRVPVLCVIPHSANLYLMAAMRSLRARTAGMEGVKVSQPMPGVVNPKSDIGSDNHPNWRGQRKIATTLLPLVETMLEEQL